MKVDRFKLMQPPGGYGEGVMVDIPELYADYELEEMLKDKVHLTELRVNLAEVTVVKNKDGKLNFEALIPPKKDEAKKEDERKSAEFLVDVAYVSIGRVTYRDLSKNPPFEKTYEVNLRNEELRNIRSVDDLRGLVLKILFKTLAPLDILGREIMALVPVLGDSLGNVFNDVGGTVKELPGKVLDTHEAAPALERRGDVGGDVAAVVRVRATIRDVGNEPSERRLPKHVARSDVAVEREPIRVVPVHARERRARQRAGRRELEPVARVADRVASEIAERASAPSLEHVEPAGDRAGNRHRVRADEQWVRAEAIPHRVERRGRGRAPGAEVSVELTVPHDGEEIASVAAVVRRDDPEREVRRDDRVDGVTTARELRGPRRRGEVVRRGQGGPRVPSRDRGVHA